MLYPPEAESRREVAKSILILERLDGRSCLAIRIGHRVYHSTLARLGQPAADSSLVAVNSLRPEADEAGRDDANRREADATPLKDRNAKLWCRCLPGAGWACTGKWPRPPSGCTISTISCGLRGVARIYCWE